MGITPLLATLYVYTVGMELDNIHEDYRQLVLDSKSKDKKIERLLLKLEAAREYRNLFNNRLAPKVSAYMMGYYRAKVESGELLSDTGFSDLDPTYVSNLRAKAKVDMVDRC